MIKTLFVDDSVMATRRVQKVLSNTCVLDCAADFGEALALIASNEYEVFLVDQSTKNSCGLELARAIRGMDIYQATPILLFSSSLNNSLAFAAMKAGINRCLEKSLSPEQLIASINKVVQELVIDVVDLYQLETKCLRWWDGTQWFEFSPELKTMVCSRSKKGVHEQMHKLLLEYSEQCRNQNVFCEDIEVTVHATKFKD